MNDSVRETLKKLIAQYGSELCANRQRLEGLLRDFCGQHRGEIAVLVAAVREGVAEEIRKASGAQVDALLFHRLVRRLCDDAGIAEDNAEWAVRSWAVALGKAVPQQRQRQSPTPAPSPQPAPSPGPTAPPPAPTPQPQPIQPVRPTARRRHGWGWAVVIGALLLALPVGVSLMKRPQGRPQGARLPADVKTRTNPTQGRPQGARLPADVKTRTNPKDGAVMVFIPAGEFTMGSNDGDEDEKPQHRVTLDGYWIYKYEVTVAQYRQFCQATGRQMLNAPPWGWKDNHPIVDVTWHDAVAYAKWAKVRLPTEAEWEKAARGTDGRKYPWGNEWGASKCNNGGRGLNQTTAVGSYPQGVSPFGVHDMAGNVWEWCADWYDENYYRSAPSKNPKGPDSGECRVLLGGSWGALDHDARCASRPRDAPAYALIETGFRCARTP